MSPGFSAVALSVAIAALADDHAGAAAGFWGRAAEPHRDKIEGLLARAQGELADRPPLGGSARPAAAPDSALRAEGWATEALRLDPSSFTATMVLGEAQARQRQAPRALRSFERARTLARTPADEAWCSLRLAIERSRAGRYAEALHDYDNHLSVTAAPAEAYTNSAEVLMALGRLGEAQDRYREAIRLESRSRSSGTRDPDEGLALAYYGLAVSLDRDEQTQAAREAAARAVTLDPKMSLLDAALEERSGVFFVPAGDVYYYRALAMAVRGQNADAAEAFQRFVAAQPAGRWNRRAELHLRALASKGGAPPTPEVVPALVAVTPPRALRIVAAGTVRAGEGVPAPLVDAAWRGRPDLIEPCLEQIPAAAAAVRPVRVALELEFDGAGAVRQAAVKGQDWPAFASCAARRLREGLRVPRPSGARKATARVELMLAPRR